MTGYKWATVLIAVILISSCRSTYQPHFAPTEYMDIKLSEDSFKYLYYNMKDANDFTYQYCEGRYKKTREGTYTLIPVSFNKDQCEATLEESVDNTLGSKIRLRAESKVYGDFEKKFKMVVHLDSTTIFTYGYKLDTLITGTIPTQIWMEVFSPSEIGSPVPFKKIKTKHLTVKDRNSNSFLVKTPIVYNSFYYANLESMSIKDLGSDYLVEKTGHRVKKEHVLR